MWNIFKILFFVCPFQTELVLINPILSRLNLVKLHLFYAVNLLILKSGEILTAANWTVKITNLFLFSISFSNNWDCLFVWCLTACQHRIGQFVPTAGGWKRLRWLRMANERQCIILNTLHNVTQITIKHSSYKNATTGYLIVWLICLNITLAPSPIPSRITLFGVIISLGRMQFCVRPRTQWPIHNCKLSTAQLILDYLPQE